MQDDVPREVKEERCNALLAIQREMSQGANEGLIGRAVEVLVDGPSKTDGARLSGRTRGNQIVIFDGPAHLAGRLVPVEIEYVSAYSLYGSRAARPAEQPRKLPTAV